MKVDENIRSNVIFAYNSEYNLNSMWIYIELKFEKRLTSQNNQKKFWN